jgi:hypothetical protein
MKRKWLGLALAAAVACAGAATAERGVIAEDSAANYTAETFVSGANLGTGFKPWEFWNAAPTLADSTAGVCGDLNSENGLSFRFARSADNEWCNGYRGFEALNVGDVLTFRFTCAYCGGGRGLDLFANGGHSDGDKVANVIHLSGNNEFSVNGSVIANNWAPYAVTEVTIVQQTDGIDLSLKRTSTEEGVEDLEYSTKVPTDKKLTGIGLYAGGSETEDGGWKWNDGKDVENYAFYVNDLKIEGIPPADTLSLTPPRDDAWQVLSASEELEFTVSRTGSEGDLEVALASSYPEFVSVPESVTIADGETSAAFTVQVALQGPGNEASISASATGVTGADYGLKGPQYRISAVGNVEPGVATNFWVDWDNNGVRDDSKLTLAIEPEGAALEADTPDTWKWNDKTDEGGNLVGAWVEAQFTAHESARMVLKFDGVEMWGADVTVLEAGATFSGPTALYTGNSGTYTLDVTLLDGMTDAFELAAVPDGLVTISPSGLQTLEASGKIEFAVEALTAGEVTLTVQEDESGLGLEISGSPITLSITDYTPPSYDDYVAYDEASLYEGTFDFASTGAGTEGFGAWQVVRSGAEYGNVDVGGGDAGMPSILSDDGKALFLYGNGGEDPSYAVVRPFANTLQPGQKASVEFVASEAGGSRVVRFVRIEESGIYNRFEIWNNSGAIGINVDGVETAINWSNGLRRVEASIELAADGSSYTLELLGHNPGSDLLVDDIYQHVVNSDVGYWGGGIQGLYFEGTSTEGDLVFNRLAIEQVAEPVEYREIGIIGTWNPDAIGDYDFYVGPAEEGEAIGTVALTVEPADGRIVIEPASVEVPGDDVAAFTVKVTSLPEEGVEAQTYTITATPADELVLPAVFYVTPSRPYLYLTSDNWEYTTDDGTIWLTLHASPSKYGTYNITTDDGAVLSIPESSTPIVLSEDNAVGAAFDVNIVGAGEASIYATLDTDPEEYTDYHFKVTPGVDPAGDVVPVKAISIKNGEMTLTLDGKGSQVFGATEVKDGGWVWQALDLAIIGDGTSVSLPMDAPKMMFKVE